MIVDRFNSFYDHIGNKQGIGKSNLPCFHLTSDLWSFELESDISKVTMSKSSLQRDIKYATFNSNLFELLIEKETRNLIKERLMLKAEEDIKTIDVRKNDSFIPPKDISDVLKNHFGEISVNPDYFYLNSRFQSGEEGYNSIFEYESERLLQEAIVKNWDQIQKFDNWNIYVGPPYGVECQVEEAGRIDILVKNKLNNNLKVIELKKGLGKAEHLGQLLRYVGWMRSKLAVDQEVNGLLIASRYKDGIQYAL